MWKCTFIGHWVLAELLHSFVLGDGLCERAGQFHQFWILDPTLEKLHKMIFQPSPPLCIRLCRVAAQPACRAPLCQLGLCSGCPLCLTGRWMRTFANFLSCTMYNLIQPGFLPALILKLACDWLSWVFPCLSNIPFQFGHIVLLGDSGPDNCMSQPFCAVWQYTGLLFFQLFGQCSCFCGLKSTSRILQSLSCSGLVPTKHCRWIWWALSQRTENMRACACTQLLTTDSHISVRCATVLCPWPCLFSFSFFLWQC